jgi:hypothetical protein
MSTSRTRYNTREFKSWDDFKRGIRDALPGAHDYDIYKRYIFRGQGNATWPLTSTFDRRYANRRAASRDALAKDLIREFYEECERYSAWRYSIDDPRVLAMAQHHGLPTRLLDWSFGLFTYLKTNDRNLEDCRLPVLHDNEHDSNSGFASPGDVR